MKIAYITAGAAGQFCGSCMRDNTLAAALANGQPHAEVRAAELGGGVLQQTGPGAIAEGRLLARRELGSKARSPQQRHRIAAQVPDQAREPAAVIAMDEVEPFGLEPVLLQR